jgi:hypothetical protein
VSKIFQIIVPDVKEDESLDNADTNGHEKWYSIYVGVGEKP